MTFLTQTGVFLTNGLCHHRVVPPPGCVPHRAVVFLTGQWFIPTRAVVVPPSQAVVVPPSQAVIF